MTALEICVQDMVFSFKVLSQVLMMINECGFKHRLLLEDLVFLSQWPSLILKLLVPITVIVHIFIIRILMNIRGALLRALLVCLLTNCLALSVDRVIVVHVVRIVTARTLLRVGNFKHEGVHT